MSDAVRTEIELEEGAFLPSGEPVLTPFAEISRLMLLGIDANQGNKILWTAQTRPNGPWNTIYEPVNDNAYIVLGTGLTMDGRVAIAAVTNASPATVHYNDEAPQAAGGAQRWNAPVDLGLPEGLEGLVQIAMQRDADGRIEIFGVDGVTGSVWWKYQNPDKIVMVGLNYATHVAEGGREPPERARSRAGRGP